MGSNYFLTSLQFLPACLLFLRYTPTHPSHSQPHLLCLFSSLSLLPFPKPPLPTGSFCLSPLLLLHPLQKTHKGCIPLTGERTSSPFTHCAVPAALPGTPRLPLTCSCLPHPSPWCNCEVCSLFSSNHQCSPRVQSHAGILCLEGRQVGCCKNLGQQLLNFHCVHFLMH